MNPRSLCFALATCVGLSAAMMLASTSRTVAADAVSSSIEYQRAVATQVRLVAEQTLPSVVSIEVIGTLQSDGEVRQDAPTSGVVIDREGYILASSWITRGPSASIIVTVDGGKRFPARVIAEDEHRELVLLKIDPRDTELQPVALESPDSNETTGDYENPTPSLAIGATTIALARYGESNVPMVSTGILSAIDRLDGTAIQCDARISPVFYGGPLLDLRGNFIGLLIPAVGENGAEDPTEWYDSGIAFAVPAVDIARKLSRLRDGDTIRSGLLGLVVGGADPYAPGTTLATVRKRSPADRAGLQTGDRLIRVGGREVRRRQEVKLALGRFDAGDEVIVEYERDGKTQTTTATLAETIEPLRPQHLGITTSGTRVTSIVPKSPADGILAIGDELRSFDGVKIEDESTLRQRMWSADPATPLEIQWRRNSDGDDSDGDDSNGDDSDGEDANKKQPITPAPWTGSLDQFELANWHQEQSARWPGEDASAWEQTTIRLPDIVNEALLWFPSPIATDDTQPDDAQPDDAKADATETDDSQPADVPDFPSDLNESAPIGLAVILMPPSQRDLAEQLKFWKKTAKQYRVAILLVASDDQERWQLSEIDAIGKLTVAAIKRAGADASAVSVVSLGVLAGQTEDATKASGPADSMALAVSLSTDNIFHGVALPTTTRPPAIRLRRDAPMRLLRVLMTSEPETELPTWSETIGRLGCPLQTSDQVDRQQLLLWCRSLLVF